MVVVFAEFCVLSAGRIFRSLLLGQRRANLLDAAGPAAPPYLADAAAEVEMRVIEGCFRATI